MQSGRHLREVAGTGSPAIVQAASEVVLCGLFSEASSLPFVPAFDAWESINQHLLYGSDRSEGLKSWRTQRKGIWSR